jgi:hypothetical protein
LTIVLLGNDVVYFVGVDRKIFVEQAILTPSLGALTHLLTQVSRNFGRSHGMSEPFS